MFGREKYPSYETPAEKAKKAAKAIGATILAASVGVAAIGLAYEGSKNNLLSPRAPIERSLDKYPGVVNESPAAGNEQIIAAGEWKAQHPGVSRIAIEDIQESYSHGAGGNAAEKADSKVKISFSDGKVIVTPGYGESEYSTSGSPSLDKKITHLTEKLGMEGGNASVINAAETESVIDALNSSIDQQVPGN